MDQSSQRQGSVSPAPRNKDWEEDMFVDASEQPVRERRPPRRYRDAGRDRTNQNLSDPPERVPHARRQSAATTVRSVPAEHRGTSPNSSPTQPTSSRPSTRSTQHTGLGTISYSAIVSGGRQGPRSSQRVDQHRSHEQSHSQSRALEELRSWKQANSDLLEELRDMRRQIRSVQSQLDDAQLFTSTADLCSDMDIIKELKALNEEVFQTASALVDEFAEHLDETENQDKETLLLFQSESIDLDLLNRLAVVKGPEKLNWLECAFQAYLSYQFCRIVTSWIDERPVNEMVERTYKRLRDAEPQEMSGRWRALTFAYISPTWTKDPNDLIQATMKGLCDIAVIAGCATSHSAALPLLSRFEEHLLSVVSLARNLRIKIAGVVSGDFEIMVIHPGEEFVEADMCLIDGEQHPPGAAKTVLCTTRVGLTKRMPDGTNGNKITTTVVKAEVVLK